MIRYRTVISVIIAILLVTGISSAQSPRTVDRNATLELYSDSITVYLFLLDECVICQNYVPELNDLYLTYGGDRIRMIGLFPNRSSRLKGINYFREHFEVAFPLKTDHYHKKTEQFAVSVTPEVVVYDEKNEKILYQGRIDNSFVRVGKRRRVTTEQELRSALQAIVDNTIIETQKTTAVGCFINFKK